MLRYQTLACPELPVAQADAAHHLVLGSVIAAVPFTAVQWTWQEGILLLSTVRSTMNSDCPMTASLKILFCVGNWIGVWKRNHETPKQSQT